MPNGNYPKTAMPRSAHSRLLRWIAAVFISLTACAVVANFISTSPAPYTPLINRSTSQVSWIGIGDQGTGSLKQWQIARAMERVAAQDGRLDMVVLLGDNFYGKPLTGVHDWNWQMKFERVYWGHYLSHIPFYAVLGNHDDPSRDVEIKYSRKHMGTGRWQMPDYTYTRDFGSVDARPVLRVVFLDTAVQPHELEYQVDLLERAFSQPGPQPLWRAVAAHHPVRNAGSHGEDAQWAALLVPALQHSHVDLYLSGHDHNLQLLLRDDEPAWLISGGGGQTIYPLPAHGIETTFAASEYGFIKVDVDQVRMQLAYYDDQGIAAARFIWNRSCPGLAKECLQAVAK